MAVLRAQGAGAPGDEVAEDSPRAAHGGPRGPLLRARGPRGALLSPDRRLLPGSPH